MDTPSHEAALALYDRLATISSPGSHAEALKLYADCLAAVGVKQRPAAERITLTTACPGCGQEVEIDFVGSLG